MPDLGFDEETIVENKEEIEIDEPDMYNVILINDDFTPFDFVIYVLMDIFNKNAEEAWKITNNVHNQGKGIAGTYVRDIAETKSITTTKLAAANEYPLETVIEKV